MSDQLGEALVKYDDHVAKRGYATAEDMAVLAAAARKWHALTINGPNYEAAARVRAEQDGLDYDAFGVSRRWAWKIATQTIVDAALGLEESVTMREEAL